MFFPARYLADTAEEFCNGDASAFAFFGGIPVPALYDNTRLVVAKILGDRAGKCSTLVCCSALALRVRGSLWLGNHKGKVGGLPSRDLYGAVSPGP
jgi:hypothetical protein